MAEGKSSVPQNENTRRDFLKTSTVAAVGTAMLGSLAVPRMAHAAQNSETIKIGLVGCGGRGTGAAADAMQADPNCKLVALADTFPDQIERTKKNLLRFKDKFAVTDDMIFSGFDACTKLLATDIDVVLLCTPPHFRPAQYREAIEAGKHVFCEKPVAVDAPGIKHVIETNALAKAKNLAVVSGLCWRYDLGVRETMQRIQDGEIGDVMAVHSNYLTGTLWHRGDNPQWSRMEYQLRNWLYYTWLSGDHITEQFVHGLDKTAWLMGDASPVKATGLGGRQQRTDKKFGHIYDHHAVVYEYANGAKVFAYTRQQDNTSRDVEEYAYGTKGTSEILAHKIKGTAGDWKYRGPKPSMYQQEHDELFASIRKGEPINNGDYMANSSMIAILGRMADYTGQTITWEQAIASQERLGPATYEWGDLPEPAVAIPGVTKLS
jgi:predicted dehydrogenase